ncbi:hypothetical protein [Prevotella intermedia]|uniref:hypothetical protein n=1 Tax=Prevotella intermedia TaxID=28131 RepID=UPI002003CFC8|nr:hypothetical protein [Prevotella intermedia]
MEIRKIALSLISVMALSATTVQAQTTNTSKKTPTAKAKICTVEKKIEGDFRCDEAKVEKAAKKTYCNAKNVCREPRRTARMLYITLR